MDATCPEAALDGFWSDLFPGFAKKLTEVASVYPGCWIACHIFFTCTVIFCLESSKDTSEMGDFKSKFARISGLH
jgi:hypothetical protein